MSRSAYRKNIRREISGSFGRFVCIFLIAALGVAFFTGIRVSEPVMMKSADRLFDETCLMDIEVISTGGLTDDDVRALSGIEGVEAVMPAYSVDMLEVTEGEQNVIKVMSIPDKLNKVKLLEGRMPAADDECLIDSALTDYYGDYRVGGKICVTDDAKKAVNGMSGSTDENDDNEDSSLSVGTFTITGVVTSPLYLDFGRGSSRLGSGSVLGYIYVPSEVFTQDFYSTIYLSGEGLAEKLSYSDEYCESVKVLQDRVEEIADERCEAREAELHELANDEIAKAREELADARREADEKLADARAELDDGYAELEDARRKLADGENEIAENEQKLADAENELSEHEREYSDALTEFTDNEQKLADARKELAKGRDELNNNWGMYDDTKVKVDEAGEQLADFERQVSEARAQFEAGKAYMPAEQAYAAEQQVLAYEQQLESSRAEYLAGTAQLAGFYAQLDAAEDEYRESERKLNSAEEELEDGRRKLEDAKKELEDGRAELEDGRRELEDAKKEIEDGRREIADGEAELADGEVEYADAVAEAEDKIKEAEQEIEDAERDAAEQIKTPVWYVLDRDYITSVGEFGMNAEKIGAIGKVFPVIFFIVAILVCLTTMTRMVEEERTEIGTLKALGYTDGQVARKFILYCLLASVLGSAFGAVLGEFILPYCIVNAYYILYKNIPYLELGMDIKLTVIAGIIACMCTLLATVLACARATREKAAELMRPVAPEPGKRVFVENIGFIWKNLSFTMKASVRNLLRYKKRFFMTIVGIGGCMALMLVGFGLHDSIFTIIDNQFFKIMVYDGIVSINNDDAGDVEELVRYVGDSPVISEHLLMHQAATNAGANDVEKEAYIVVPSGVDSFGHYIYMGDRRSGESFSLGDYTEGVVINEKLADLLNVGIGDSIYLTDDDNARINATVAQITENYVYNYVYMVPEMYRRLFGELPEYNVLYFNERDGIGHEEEDSFGRTVLEMDAATGINYSRTSADSIYDMMSSLNFVVYVLVIAAALLAFVVLYNLSNININERRRELATLKVLGFYDKEVSAYVYRENIMLTIIGTALGVVFGIFLHRYVIMTAEVDMTLFGRQIKPLSYAYSAALTFAFAALVNWVMHFKLKKIDMVESLKSIE